jgi:hypothetical protein
MVVLFHQHGDRMVIHGKTLNTFINTESWYAKRKIVDDDKVGVANPPIVIVNSLSLSLSPDYSC